MPYAVSVLILRDMGGDTRFFALRLIAFRAYGSIHGFVSPDGHEDCRLAGCHAIAGCRLGLSLILGYAFLLESRK
jgi:hypothetical protein